MIEGAQLTWVEEMLGFYLLPKDLHTVFYIYPNEHRDIFAQFNCKYGNVFTLFEPNNTIRYLQIEAATSADLPLLFIN